MNFELVRTPSGSFSIVDNTRGGKRDQSYGNNFPFSDADLHKINKDYGESKTLNEFLGNIHSYLEKRGELHMTDFMEEENIEEMKIIMAKQKIEEKKPLIKKMKQVATKFGVASMITASFLTSFAATTSVINGQFDLGSILSIEVGATETTSLTASDVTELNTYFGGTKTLSDWANLTFLQVNRSPHTTPAPLPNAISKLSNLKSLDINYGPTITSIPDLSGLTSLETLNITSSHDRLTSLPNISGLPNLWYINYSGLPGGIASANFSNLPALRSVTVNGGGVSSVSFTNCPNIWKLNLSLEGANPSVSGINTITALEEFSITSINSNTITGLNLTGLTSLRILNLGFVDTPSLSGLSALRELSITASSNGAARYIAAASSLTNLDSIYLDGNGAIAAINSIVTNRPGISRIDIRGDSTTTSIPAGITTLNFLSYLNLSGNSGLTSGINLSSMPRLREVHQVNTPGLNASNFQVPSGAQVFR